MSKLVWLSVLLMGLVCAALWRGAVFAQNGLWDTCVRAGERAQQQGRTADAARLYQVAIRRAGRFGPHDPRRVTSLLFLADLYRAQGDAARAAPLYQRALALAERSLAPDAPAVLACRQRWAAMRSAAAPKPPALAPP